MQFRNLTIEDKKQLKVWRKLVKPRESVKKWVKHTAKVIETHESEYNYI